MSYLKKSIIPSLGLLAGTCGALGLEWGGEYENTFMLNQITNENQNKEPALSDQNRLKLRMEADAGAGIYFRGQLMADKWFGKKKFFLKDMFPAGLAEQVNGWSIFQQGQMDVLNYYTPTQIQTVINNVDSLYYSVSDSIWLDKLYAGWQKERTQFIIGLQPIVWGAGKVWNPTNIWNKKDLMDLNYELPGSPAVRLEHGIGGLSLAVTAGFSDELENTPVAAEIRAFSGGFDWVLTAVRKRSEILVDKKRMDLTNAASEEAVLASFWDYFYGSDIYPWEQVRDRYTLGAHSSGTIADEVGVWTELAWHYWNTDGFAEEGNYTEIVAGMDYTFGVGNGLYIMAEYLFNENGKENASEYTFADWMNYFNGISLSMAKHTAFGTISYPVTDFTTVMVNAIGNLNDGSVMINPWINVNLSDESEVQMNAAIPMGDKGTQFSKGLGGQVRWVLSF